MYGSDGTDCMRDTSERKRPVQAFVSQTGATPEPLCESGAYFCVKDSRGKGSSPFEFGWYHESLRPIYGGGAFLFNSEFGMRNSELKGISIYL